MSVASDVNFFVSELESSFSNQSDNNCTNLTLADNGTEPEPRSYTNNCIVATSFLITSILGLLSYIPCMYAMYNSKQLRSPCYTFMLSLGVSDCTSLIGWIIVGIDTLTNGERVPKQLMTVVMCFLVIGWGSLTTHEVMIAINRFVAVVLPTKQETMFSKRKMKLLLGLSWFYAIFIHAMATFIPPNMYYSLDGYYAVWASDDVTLYYTYEDITCCSMVFAVCVFCYSSIMIKFTLVRRQITPASNSKGSKNSNSRKDMIFQFRLALQTAVRCLTFFVYDVLYYVVSLYSTNLWAVFICSTYLWCLNNALNPWVYLIFNEQLRKVLKNYIIGKKDATGEATTGMAMQTRVTVNLKSSVMQVSHY